ncbi:MAG: Trm112 family protein [Phycisphaera sp.]|nr:Trm112 family protein [Phycisphaera sp.]
MPDQPMTSEFDDALLDVLVCPVTRSALRREGDVLVGEAGGLRYPIRDGLAVLLPGEAALPDGVESLEAFRERFGATPGA